MLDTAKQHYEAGDDGSVRADSISIAPSDGDIDDCDDYCSLSFKELPGLRREKQRDAKRHRRLQLQAAILGRADDSGTRGGGDAVRRLAARGAISVCGFRPKAKQCTCCWRQRVRCETARKAAAGYLCPAALCRHRTCRPHAACTVPPQCATAGHACAVPSAARARDPGHV